MQKLMVVTEDLGLCSQPSYRDPETLILQKGGLPISAQNHDLCEMKMKRVSQSCNFVSICCKKLLLLKIFLKVRQNKMMAKFIPILKFAWPLHR
jgi:hypothetical protein